MESTHNRFGYVSVVAVLAAPLLLTGTTGHGVSRLIGDINGDGVVEFADIDPFDGLLGG